MCIYIIIYIYPVVILVALLPMATSVTFPKERPHHLRFDAGAQYGLGRVGWTELCHGRNGALAPGVHGMFFSKKLSDTET